MLSCQLMQLNCKFYFLEGNCIQFFMMIRHLIFLQDAFCGAAELHSTHTVSCLLYPAYPHRYKWVSVKHTKLTVYWHLSPASVLTWTEMTVTESMRNGLIPGAAMGLVGRTDSRPCLCRLRRCCCCTWRSCCWMAICWAVSCGREITTSLSKGLKCSLLCVLGLIQERNLFGEDRILNKCHVL